MKWLLWMVCVVGMCNAAAGQANQWTWMRGDTTPPYSATEHQGDTGYMPKYRQTASWRDAKGGFYIFGGLVNESFSSQSQYLNDLWKYDPASNAWTWLKGDTGVSRINGVYGTRGVAASQNKPGSRFGAATWTDAQGNLWLFGGYGMQSNSQNATNLNDLWRYTPSTNQWTWVKGDSLNPGSSYGTQGVASAGNLPPGRSGATAWKDAAGNLWLFGGGLESTAGATFFFSDLWKYNISTSQWTWMKGPSIGNVIGVYGTQGIAAAANNPPAMYYSCPFTDLSGNLWLFGGGVVKFGTFNLFNDMWKYSPSVNAWTWIKGKGISQQYGVYGTRDVPNATNNPGSRCYSASCTNTDGIFWLFGGLGYDTRYVVQQDLNDLWSYNTSTNSWTWHKGDSSIFTGNNNGHYGTMGVPDLLNNPAGRRSQCQWFDTAHNFWIFGGYGQTANGQGSRNDLWKINLPPTSLPVHLLTFTARLQDNKPLLTWTVENEQNFDRYQIERSNNGKDFTPMGSVKANNSKAYSYIDAAELSTGVRYYRLKLIDRDGKFEYSPIRSLTINHSSFTITPNPAHDRISLSGSRMQSLTIVDMTGKIVLQQSLGNTDFSTINIARLAKGVYTIKIKAGDGEQVEKLVVE